MPFVLDASAAANWFLPDESPLAAPAWMRMSRDDALVPLHWWFEIRSIMLIAERRGRISERYVSYMSDRISTLRIVEAQRPNDAAVFALARHHGLTFYDAVYLELAQRERLDLATLDKKLAAAARDGGVSLIVAG